MTRFQVEFNGSLQVEGREERITSDAGAVAIREVMERLRVTRWLSSHLTDTRKQKAITHPLAELLQTSLILLGLGWRDQDDADTLRDDPSFRLAVSTRRGTAPLLPPPEGRERTPDGLASQPTLSRLVRMLSGESNRAVLREAALVVSSRRIRASRGGKKMAHVTVDVDSLPIEVEGHQPGSEYNGHYRARIYHPLVATIAETGDIIDAKLRPGNAHTAEGGVDFILPLVDAVETRLARVASVRIDAGFPEEGLLSALERRKTPYVARIRNNPVLNRMAEPFLRRPPGLPPDDPRTWAHELSYGAESWSRERRMVLVVQERPDELFLHHFWLVTNWTEQQMSAQDLLDIYRVRGAAEGHMGELMSVLDPALSSSPRQKTHYRGQPPKAHVDPGDSFAQNEVILLLNILAYNLVHAVRRLMEEGTGHGWSVRGVRERILRVAGRMLLHGRRVILVVAQATVAFWQTLWRRMDRMKLVET
jgi:hypothetical protein